MKAVILAGGKGTRLQSRTNNIPKPMVPIAGVPLLEYQIRLLARYNIRDIIILTGFLADKIESYFQEGQMLGVRIQYYHEKKPLGTTGGLKEIEDMLTQDFLLLYGDVMVEMELTQLLNFHRQKQAFATLVLHPNDHPYDSDLVEISDDSKITAFYPKPREKGKYYLNLVNAGFYVLSPYILSYIQRNVNADFGRDIFPKIVSKVPLYGYITSEYAKDMGTPQRLEEVTKDLLSGKIESSNISFPQKAIFLDRDGVINQEVNLLSNPEDFKMLDGAGEAIRAINQSRYLAIVITNQSVIARNLCSLGVLREIHNKMETLLGQVGAKLDAIYFCPHHPDCGYPGENSEYKRECDCRKPKPGMVQEAAKRFNIDLSQSYFIGDTARDIECGHRAGTKTIALRSGHGVQEPVIIPDNTFENLLEAVHFILGILSPKK